MRILIVGYGFVGKHLVRRLILDGHEVSVMDKFPIRSEGFTAISADARYVHGPLKFDRIFHLAGVTNAAYAEANPIETYEANVLSTLNLLKQTEGRFVFTSSAVVYGQSDEPLKESDPLAPISLYGQSKKHAEELIRRMSPDFRIARFFNLYGPSQSPLYIVPQLMEQARNGKLTLRNGDMVVVAGIMVLAVLYLFEPGPVLSFVKHVWP